MIRVNILLGYDAVYLRYMGTDVLEGTVASIHREEEN